MSILASFAATNSWPYSGANAFAYVGSIHQAYFDTVTDSYTSESLSNAS